MSRHCAGHSAAWRCPNFSHAGPFQRCARSPSCPFWPPSSAPSLVLAALQRRLHALQRRFRYAALAYCCCVPKPYLNPDPSTLAYCCFGALAYLIKSLLTLSYLIRSLLTLSYPFDTCTFRRRPSARTSAAEFLFRV
jgi:hypothetical protein